MKHTSTFIACLLTCWTATAFADEVAYLYEGDVLPYDPSAGWIVANPCEAPACSEGLESGHFVLEYGTSGGDLATYARFIVDNNGILPSTFWVEWRFRSNNPRNPSFPGCDGQFSIAYNEILDVAYLNSNAVVSREGGDSVTGLDPLLFQTHRFESLDGLSYRFSVNGIIYNENTTNKQGSELGAIQFRGNGGCFLGTNKKNEWDYVRHGTIDGDEQVISFDPAGNPAVVEPFDRFVMVFDRPGYVYIDDIEVTTTAGQVPVVKYTWRRENDGPETLEIVLEDFLPADETTTFRFPTISGAPEVSYTPQIILMGACCLTDGTCQETDDASCASTGGSFILDASCEPAQACCFSSGACDDLAPVCCVANGGTNQGSATLCEGDADHDGMDGVCGDACPNDPENDIDGDGICGDLDDCPQLNPNDANDNGTPDCLEEPAIPTVSTWGLVILGLLLICAARVVFARRGSH